MSLYEPLRDLPCVLSHGNVLLARVKTVWVVCCLITISLEYLCKLLVSENN